MAFLSPYTSPEQFGFAQRIQSFQLDGKVFAVSPDRHHQDVMAKPVDMDETVPQAW